VLDIAAELGRHGLVPVVEIADARHAVALGRALIAGGLPVAEITFRTDAAADAMAALRDECPEILVGAGTVLDTRDADRAVAAGASFLVAPGFNPTVVRHARDRGVPMIPGVCTPSEIEQALEFAPPVLKFFPAEASGGVGFLRALAGPYRSVRFVPTGGIGPVNLAAYLALPQVVACGGSWMVPPDRIAAGDLGAVERLAREAVEAVAACRAMST
jgi:2-dehydro-3-deoxyphosphogluconate aldolase/(4S)-4-hydroxy-2-oxoglutarate aldolase